MKPPKEWLSAAEKASFKPTVMLRVIAEIQRDAREGMVPMDEVWPLLQALRFASHPDSAASMAKRGASDAVAVFRAKHPNLFTT